jgi:hypothetical protein
MAARDLNAFYSFESGCIQHVWTELGVHPKTMLIDDVSVTK